MFGRNSADWKADCTLRLSPDVGYIVRMAQDQLRFVSIKCDNASNLDCLSNLNLWQRPKKCFTIAIPGDLDLRFSILKSKEGQTLKRLMYLTHASAHA